MKWQIYDDFDLFTELDREVWGAQEDLLVIARMSYAVQDEIKEAFEGYGESVGVVEEAGLREYSPLLDRKLRELDEQGQMNLSIEEVIQLNAEREAALAAGWEPAPPEDNSPDEGHRLSAGQKLAASYLADSARDAIRAVNRKLQDIAAEMKEADERECEEGDSDPNGGEDAAIEELFDELEDEDEEEEGREEEPGGAFSIERIELPAEDKEGVFLVIGKCDWDPERGFRLAMRAPR